MASYEFNVRFQNMIASVILRNYEISTKVRSVVFPEYFTDPVLRKIISYAIDFQKEYRATPSLEEFLNFTKVELSKTERGRVRKLFKLKVKNPNYVTDQIIEFARYNAMREAILESSDLIDDFDNRLQIKALINDALKVGVDSRKLGISLLGGRRERIIERIREGVNYTNISTGIPKLDKMFNGGPDRGELHMLMAPPKGFKTGVLVNFAVAALAQRLKVAIYTLEISERKYTMRVERRIAGMSRQELVNKDEELEKALRRIEKLKGGMFVKGNPMRSIGVEYINNHLDFLSSEGFHADVVFIDYWDLLAPKHRDGEHRHQLTSIGADMRAMAQERNILVWTASQVNRKAVDKKIIRMEDIAEDFGKIAIVDGAVAICQTKEERQLSPPRARLFVAANREGEATGIAYITIDYDKMRIRPLKEEYVDD